jgi:hypothetical protein
MSTNSNNERWIERLFERLATKYGRDFMNQYVGLEPDAVKADWAHELRDYTGERGGQIMRWALDNLPERVPNSIRFHNICRQAPRLDQAVLPMPPAKPLTDDQRAALEALKRPVHRPHGRRHEWAHLLAEKDAKDPKSITPTVRQIYKSVVEKYPERDIHAKEHKPDTKGAGKNDFKRWENP